MYLFRRLAGAVVVVVVTTVTVCALVATLLPKQSPAAGAWDGTVTGVRHMLLHRDFGISGVVYGQVPVTTLFDRGAAIDLTLLVGGMVAGTLLGLAGGRWCAARPRALGARALDGFSALMLSTPVYSVGLLLLLLFEATFGSLVHVHGFFEPGRYEPLHDNPWHWFEAMLVPWLLVGIPIAAIALRLTAAQTVDNLHAPYVQTAEALGLRRRRVLGHAARPTYAATVAALGTQVRALVFNIMFVEYLFFLPGFLMYTKRAIGQDPPKWTEPDVTTLAGIAIWTAVLVVALTLIADVLGALLDPRVALDE
jgi:peptide/nickel transport system permease protein